MGQFTRTHPQALAHDNQSCYVMIGFLPCDSTPSQHGHPSCSLSHPDSATILLHSLS